MENGSLILSSANKHNHSLNFGKFPLTHAVFAQESSALYELYYPSKIECSVEFTILQKKDAILSSIWPYTLLIKISLPPQLICLEHETFSIGLSVFYEKLPTCRRAMFALQK